MLYAIFLNSQFEERRMTPTRNPKMVAKKIPDIETNNVLRTPTK